MSLRFPHARRALLGSWVVVITLSMACSPRVVASELDEVVVTAQRREQRAQEVGIAMTVISGRQLAALGKSDSVQIAALIPGVTLSGSSGNQSAQFSIRGVTQNDFSDHVEAPNAVYVDEGYIGFSQGQQLGLFDLERVELLKGPQGTLFGRNATGGLVHFITHQPAAERSAYAALAYGSFNQVRVEGAVGGAVSPSINGRLSFLHDQHQPILHNDYAARFAPAGEAAHSAASDLWNDHQHALRGQLEFVGDGVTNVLVSAYLSRKKISSANWQQVATTAVTTAAGAQYDAVLAKDNPANCMIIVGATGACSGGVRPVAGGDYFGYVSPDPKTLRVAESYARLDSNRYGTYGTTVKLTSELAGAELAAISHYMHFTKQQAQDVDESPVRQLLAMTNSHNDTFSQEWRLSNDWRRLHWLAGIYYLDLLTVYNQALADEAGDGSGQIRIFGESPGEPSLEGAFRATLRTRSLSAFGQVDFPLATRWSVIAGLRLIQERKRYRYTSGLYVNTNDNVVANNGPAVGAFLPAFSASTGNGLWAGKLQLEYRPRPHWLFYGGMNRGVKAGSFNAPLSSVLTPAEYAYQPEVLTSLETGLKAGFFSGRLEFDGSVYYYAYQDYQAFVLKQVSGAISNVRARYRGFELQLNAAPNDDWLLSTSWAYSAARVPHYLLAPGVVRDVVPAFTPRNKLVVQLRYLVPHLIGAGRVSLQFDATRTSAYFQNLQNYRSMRAEGSLLGNFRADWRPEGTLLDWEIGVFVRNIGNLRNKTTGVDLSGLCGCTEQAYGDPRWFGVELRVGL